ncbi:hypothetical protein K227x_31420 [Rubripirellula lacrimiformis]|uniref:Uncharacterized protein n=1 Tax=Rubripirellula lacrimiformis TaxID=1930273 RepID=A0A517NC87_9BACT|nr:hypothetical protein [Rubripirellula lacrimiformis]QDT04747.1 hypothetical protein K227x_31420 [Rubripirellula lacrimiformis]
MHLVSKDILIHRFVPDDGAPTAAVRVTHRTERKDAICNATISPHDNLRTAMAELVEKLNPHPDHIGRPKLLMFDEVTLKLPESTQDGLITEMLWNFTRSQWQYFVKCRNDHASGVYDFADLQLFEEA